MGPCPRRLARPALQGPRHRYQLSGAGPDMQLDVRPGDPTSSKWTVSQSSRFRREGWDCEMKVEIEMRSDARHFFVKERLSALKDGQQIFTRERRDKIARRTP